MDSSAAIRARLVRPVIAGALMAALVVGMVPPVFAAEGDTTPPPMPGNLTPAAGASLDLSAFTSATWTASVDTESNPVTYDFEVSASNATDGDGSFTSPIISLTGLTVAEATSLSLSASGTYYWHARAVDAEGNASFWSTASALIVTGGSGGGSGTTTPDTTAPSMPGNLTPAAGATLSSSAFTSATWTVSTDDSGDPVTYEFEISASAAVDGDGSFTTPVASSTGLTSASASVSAMAEGTYYWHVRALDASGNASFWSTVSTVIVANGGGSGTTTPDTEAPAQPGNVWPYHGLTLTSAAMTHVEWTESSDNSGGDVTYDYEVSNSASVESDGSFSSPIYTANDLTDHMMLTPGTGEGTYYWHVRACDEAGNCSGWSTMTMVTVDNGALGGGGVGAGTATIGTSTAVFPTHNATVTPDELDAVDWTDATGGSGDLSYVYQYSWSTDTESNGDFTHPSFTSGVLTSSEITIHPYGKAPGHYYWHVRALDEDGNLGPWSDIFHFIISGTTTGTSTGTTTPTTSATTTMQTITVHFADLINAITATSTGWFFYDDLTDTVNNALGSFVGGPGSAFGAGSAQMTASGTDRINLATTQFRGISLADLAALSFSTYAHAQATTTGSTTPVVGAAPYLQFNVDFDGSDTWQRRLVYVPRLNGTVTENTWQTWDAIDGGNALWLYSGAMWPGTTTLGTTARTWSDIIASYPGIAMRTIDSWLGFRVGEPYPGGFTGNVDNFTIGVTASSTVGSTTSATTTVTAFDFEPDTATTTPENNNTGGGGGGGGGGGAVGTSGQFVGASTAGNGNGSVLGSFIEIPTALAQAPLGQYFPGTGSVLGASDVLAQADVTPGAPSTGAGGNAIVNTLIMVLSALLIAGGITMLLTWRRDSYPNASLDF